MPRSKVLDGEGVRFLLSSCGSWLSIRGFGTGCAGATASNGACFSSSLDGGELFSRIQDRGDQAFTERGMEPLGTWGFAFGPFLAVDRSVSGPVNSLNRSFESPAGFYSWGNEECGCKWPCFSCSLESRVRECFLNCSCASSIPLQPRQELW